MGRVVHNSWLAAHLFAVRSIWPTRYCSPNIELHRDPLFHCFCQAKAATVRVVLDYRGGYRGSSYTVVSVVSVDPQMDTSVDDSGHRLGGLLLDALDYCDNWEDCRRG